MRLALFFCLVLFSAPAALCADDGPSADKLIGLWGGERIFGPSVSGTLTVDGRAGAWQAEIAGLSAEVQHSKDEISFALPGKQGAFRGHLASDGKTISGFWIQPAGVTFDNGYATPVTLHQIETQVWDGAVRPLSDRVSLYLMVKRADDGSLKGFIRNPEFNLGRSRDYTLTLDGDHVGLVNANRKDEQSQGLYGADRDILSVTLDHVGTFDLTRRSADAAPGFYPVTPAGPYLYRPPIADDDGWNTASLTQAGLDPKPLTALVERLRDQTVDGYKAPYIQSLLVAHHGKLALEEYFYGFDRDRAHDTRSSGKTLAGTLTGIALDHGARFKLDSSVYALYGKRYADFTNLDPRKQQITVRDLLTMDSGLACDDNDDDSPGNEDTMQGQDQQPDWYKYILDVPMMDPPGDKKAVYCTAAINLLGGVISSSTGMALTDFFQKYYAEPLKIRDYHMNLMPSGEAYLGGGIYLKPRDMLKLGQLYLDGGIWDGKRVLSKTWVTAATTQHSYFPASDYAPGHGYGYTWHLFEVKVGDKTYQEYMAQGNGGQLVMVVPALDLAVVITAGNYGNFPVWRKYFEELMPQYLIPAAGR